MKENLIEHLHIAAPSEKRNALEALYDHCCDDRVLEAAAELLTDPDRGVREAASHILVLCSSEKAASLTAVYISSRNIVVRNLAGDTLVRMGKPATRALLPYVDSTDKDVRKFAVDLIALLPSTTAAVSKVAGHLDDPDPNVVCASIDALGSMHAEQYLQRILTLFDKLDYAKPNIVNTAAMFHNDARLQFFVDALSDEDPVVQLAAAEALSTRRDGDLLKVLLAKLETVSDLAKPVVLHSIVVLLESTDYSVEIPRSLRQHLLQMLDDSDPAYIRAAVRGLRHFIDDDVLAALVSHAGKSESVDNAILSILRNYPENAIPVALAYSRSSGEVVRPAILIISLIQNMPGKDTSGISTEVLDEAASFIADNFTLLDAEAKITALGVRGVFVASSAVKLIRAGLRDPESAVKSLALDLAARTGPQFFGYELQTLKGDYDEEIRLAATALVLQMKPGFQNQD